MVGDEREYKAERGGYEKENYIFFSSGVYSCITCVKKKKIECFNHEGILDQVLSAQKHSICVYSNTLVAPTFSENQALFVCNSKQ